MNDKKANQNNSSSEIAQQSSRASGLAVARALDRVAEVLKLEVSSKDAKFWGQILASCPSEMIERAFGEWLRNTEYRRLPLRREILTVISAYEGEARQRAVEVSAKVQRREENAARERGEMVGVAEVMKTFKELLNTKAMSTGTAESSQCERHRKISVQRSATPPDGATR